MITYLVWWLATRYIMAYWAGWMDRGTRSDGGLFLTYVALLPWLGDLAFFALVVCMVAAGIVKFFATIYQYARQ